MLPNYPFVSVVCCAFNEEKRLASCLESLSRQTYPADRFDVLIIDNGSGDDTANIAERFARQQSGGGISIRVVRKSHGGLAGSRNYGIRLTKGEIVAYIDADAIAEPTWLEELVRAFSQGADYVGGRIDLLNEESALGRFLQATRHRQFFGPKIFNDQFIGCNMAFRRTVFASVGDFDVRFASRGDDSSFRARLESRFQYGAAPTAVVRHERPASVVSYLRTEWRAATLASLVADAVGAGIQWRVVALRVEQLLVALWPFCVIGASVAPTGFVLPLLLSSAGLVRRLFLRPLNREIARGLFRQYGIVRGLVAHVVFGIVFDAIHVLGAIAGRIGYYRARPEGPAVDETVIFSILDSRDASGGRAPMERGA